MAILIADHITSVVEMLKEKVEAALQTHLAFVENLERHHFHPELAECTLPLYFTDQANYIDAINEQIKRYSLLDSSLAAYTDDIDELIGLIADRFMSWTQRKLVSTKEAMQIFKRSKSTIYRWIRAGKLNAQKQGGRWQIFV